jgi:hypothetical protein
LRFQFLARDAIHFPAGQPVNILRGGFGLILERLGIGQVFNPRRESSGPSGFADPARPFVFRATHLDGATIAPGEQFHFGLNFFDMRNPALIGRIADAFAELGREGIGPGRGRAELDAFAPPAEPLVLSLDTEPHRIRRVRVEFVTPTELKGADSPEFGTLAARIRDRLSTLRELYDDGPLAIDFRAFGERARQVHMTRCDIRDVSRTRRSSRTGQSHPIGGFIGSAEYEGDLAEFLPYLSAASWTGVGRQTVWGKGELRISALESK